MKQTSVIKNRCNAILNKTKSAVPALLTTSAVFLTNASMFCDNATVTSLVKVIGFVVGALGAGLAVAGVIQLLPAIAEGDGPAKNKATMKMIAGGVMIVLGALFATVFGPIIQNAFTFT